MKVKKSYSEIIYCLLFYFLAVALQAFVTPKIFGSSIRISAADLLLPCLLLGLIVNHVRVEPNRPIFFMPNMWIWLSLLSVMFSFSLIDGYFFIGQLQSWAFINKFLGWFVLIAYLVLGALVNLSFSDGQKKIFLKLLLISASLICLFELKPVMETYLGYNTYWRPLGLTGNPNSFGLLLVIIFLVSLSLKLEDGAKPGKLDNLLFMWLIFWVILSGSRSAWLALIAGVMLLIFLRKENLALVLTTILGGLLLFVLFQTGIPYIEHIIQLLGLGTAEIKLHTATSYLGRDNILYDAGVSERWLMLERGYELWRQNPLFGTGLGGFLHNQISLGSQKTMHNTAGWIVVEMGALGLILFTLFLIRTVSWLWKNQKQQNVKNCYFLMGLAVLFALVAASLGMEAMYQRHIWFFAGLALSTRPVKKLV